MVGLNSIILEGSLAMERDYGTHSRGSVVYRSLALIYRGCPGAGVAPNWSIVVDIPLSLYEELCASPNVMTFVRIVGRLDVRSQQPCIVAEHVEPSLIQVGPQAQPMELFA
jgi:hypothetical protein